MQSIFSIRKIIVVAAIVGIFSPYLLMASMTKQQCLNRISADPGTPASFCDSHEDHTAANNYGRGAGTDEPRDGNDEDTEPRDGNDEDTEPRDGNDEGPADRGSAGGGGPTYKIVEERISLDNPLEGGGITSVSGLIQTLLQVLIVIAAPIIVLFIMLAGFKYVTAQGDPGKLEEAKRALVYAIIGGVIVVGATAIFEIIVNTINAFSGRS